MERSDGKNPFHPETYNTPAPSIQTMLELRAFCADFFQKRIRNGDSTEEEDIASFLALIIHSPSYFARARAVIPELQAPESEYSNPNDNVKVFLYATRGMRGPPGKKWDYLPEEPAWTKLAKDGMEIVGKDLTYNGTGHKKQLSDASSRTSLLNPTVLAPEKAEDKLSDSPLRSSMNVEGKPKTLPKKLDLSDIPTFVPRNVMGSGELVWSPTSGTRQCRPDEIFQQSTKARPATPTQFGQGISPNATPASSIKSQYPFHGSRGFSDSPTRGHRQSDSIRMTPPPQFKSTQSPLNPSAARPPRSNGNPNPRRARHNREPSFPRSIERMMEMTTLSHHPSSRYSPTSHFDATSYPVASFSRENSPSQFRGPRFPSSQARGVYGAEPFSAPPSVPGYGDLHQTGQGMYGGPPSPFQGQLSHFQPRFDAAPSHAFAGQVPYPPNHEIWSMQSSHSHQGAPPNQTPNPIHGAFANQIPNLIIQPTPQRITQAQIPPFIAQAPPTTDALVVPPPGSMPPLDYWNMLYQRETETCTRLRNANRPMTTQEHQYISLISEARISAAATQMPARGNLSKGKWIAELNRTLRSIWKTGPGGPGFHPVVVARKMDFEKAVEREIAVVSRERKFGGAVDRAYGA